MSKQSLQKFTDFKELGKLKGKEFKGALLGLGDYMDYMNYLTDIINSKETAPEKKEKHIELLIKALKAVGDKSQAKEIKRLDYEDNEAKIKSYLHNWALTNNQFPNIANIAEGTGLSRTTVYKHLNNNKLKEVNTDGDKGTIKTLRAVALEKLLKLGIQNDDTKALGMFLRLTEDKKDNTPPKVVNNNYLIINKTVISQERIEALPDEAIEEIKNIIELSSN
jgi:DNA-binding phage protein